MANMLQKEVCTRVEALRSWMRSHKLNAFIFPCTDPHCGEYVPDHWKTREWISGFNGSAGTAVVTLTRAALWTDSRYWLAADEQLEGTPFEVMRCRRNVVTPGELAEWLSSEEGSEVGIDGWCVAQSYAESLHTGLKTYGLTLHTDIEPASELWAERPTLPLNPVEIQPVEYAGETATDKMKHIREAMQALGANATVITQLDDIAWTLNLRGTDVHCTPVFVSYLLLLPDETILFVEPQKLTPTVQQYLDSIDVRTLPYSAIATHFSQGCRMKGLHFLVDSSTTNSAIYSMIDQCCDKEVSSIVEGECPVALMKALKNDTEITGYRSAMLKDGVAMVQFLCWLDEAMQRGERVTELTVCDKLCELRSQQPLFRDISFDTIAGYAAHGAIVHYEPTPETDIQLQPKGLLLLDSGAQYQDGTTDITRTIPLGPLTDDERRDYTLVLKGHIRLAMARFPVGTTGTQLDVLARYAMWQHGLNYGHGTGHGVGSYLSVHEGPHQFRMNWMPTPLQANMTVTIEPGIYIAGSHGVRHENTMLIVSDGENDCGQWLRIEPLTLCPIHTSPIVREMMSQDEIEYLNAYHSRVREALLPLLHDDAERQWLIAHTEAI